MTLSEYIENRKIDGEFRSRLQSFPEPDSGVILQIIESLNPSGNALREIIRVAGEVSHRDGLGLAAVLGDERITSVLLNKNLNFKERQHRVRELLDARRYPLLAALRDELDACKREVRSTSGLSLELPQDLEGDTVVISIAARSADELKSAADKIEALSESAPMKRIFSILKGDLSNQGAQ